MASALNVPVKEPKLGDWHIRDAPSPDQTDHVAPAEPMIATHRLIFGVVLAISGIPVNPMHATGNVPMPGNASFTKKTHMFNVRVLGGNRESFLRHLTMIASQRPKMVNAPLVVRYHRGVLNVWPWITTITLAKCVDCFVIDATLLP